MSKMNAARRRQARKNTRTPRRTRCKEPSGKQSANRTKLARRAKACGGTKNKPVTRAQWKKCMKRG